MRLNAMLILLLLHVSALAGGDPRVPEIIRHKHNPAVLAWVSESAAFDPAGRLREDLAAASPILERNMRANADGRCKHFIIQPPTEHFRPGSTLTDVATHALVALSGNVVHVARGFYNDFPGTLIGFRVTDRVRLDSATNPIEAERGSIRYAFIGAAEIRTPAGAICSKTPRTLTLPNPGDAILMFAYTAPVAEGDLIVSVDGSRHLLIERNGKRVFTPVNLAEDVRGLTIPEALRRAAEIAERRRSRP